MKAPFRFLAAVVLIVAFIGFRSAVAQDSRPASAPAADPEVLVRDESSHLVLRAIKGFSAPKKIEAAATTSRPTTAQFTRYVYESPRGARAEVTIIPWKAIDRAQPMHVFQALDYAGDIAVASLSTRLGSRQKGWSGAFPWIRYGLRVTEKSDNPMRPLFLQVVGFPDDAMVTTLTAADEAAIDVDTTSEVFGAADRFDIPVPTSYRVIFREYEISHPPGWMIGDASPLLELTAPDKSVGFALGFEDNSKTRSFGPDENLAAVSALTRERTESDATILVRRSPENTLDSGRYVFSEIEFTKSNESAKSRVIRYYPSSVGRFVVSAFYPAGDGKGRDPVLTSMLDSVKVIARPTSAPTSSPTK